MRKNKLNIISLFMAVLFLAFGVVGSAYAEEKPDYRIAISPSYDAMDVVKPGSEKTGSFELLNEGTKDFDYEISFAPYTVTNEKYEADFSTENKYTDIREWITVDEMTGTVDAGKEKKLHYTVKVPEDFHGGMQSAAILVTMKNASDQSGNIEAVHQLAYVIYANVDGEVVETGKILENKISGFLFNPPIMASSLVENTGNVYTRATYKLQVFPLFSDEEVYTNEETPENNIVFPETKRYNEIKWDGAPQLGIFKVRSTVKIFDQESVEEKLVFLCPIWFLFIVILLIFLIIFWIVSRVLKRKREA